MRSDQAKEKVAAFALKKKSPVSLPGAQANLGTVRGQESQTVDGREEPP